MKVHPLTWGQAVIDEYRALSEQERAFVDGVDRSRRELDPAAYREQALAEIMDLAGAYAVAYADYSQRDIGLRDMDAIAAAVTETRQVLEQRIRQALTGR